MNADQRGWIVAAGLAVVFTSMAPYANGDESLFLLTSRIEQLGGEEMTAGSSTAVEEESSQDDSLRYDELRLTGPVHVDSITWRLIRVGDGARLLVPAVGPAPITLDFAFPPVFDWEMKGIEKQYDHPTTPTAPRRDDSYLLAEKNFTFGGMKFSR